MTTERVRNIIAGICSDLEFDEAYHRYTLNEQLLTPVTQMVNSFAHPFPKWDIAKATAAKYSKQSDKPVTAAEIVHQWDKERDDAATKGIKIHHFIDPYPHLKRAPDCPEEQGALNWFEQLPDHYKPVGSEKRLYSTAKKIGGTTDRIFFNEQTGKLLIVDWKSNKDIHKNYKGKTLKAPYEHLLDSPLSKYKLQLNYYKLCLEEHLAYHDIFVGEMQIIWLHPSLPNFFEVYPVEPIEINY